MGRLSSQFHGPHSHWRQGRGNSDKSVVQQGDGLQIRRTQSPPDLGPSAGQNIQHVLRYLDESVTEAVIAIVSWSRHLTTCHHVACHRPSTWQIRHRNKYYYTPGAAADEESWARHLTPAIFWKYSDRLLDPTFGRGCRGCGNWQGRATLKIIAATTTTIECRLMLRLLTMPIRLED
jgi:hypothetical protein